MDPFLLFYVSFPRLKNLFLVAGLGLAVGACSSIEPNEVSRNADPLEGTNRAVHGFNKGLDQLVLRPAGTVYTAVLPDDVETMVSNAASNLGEPSNAINHLAQGDAKGFGINFYRFLINSTLGLGGIYDVAAEVGVTHEDTDFGETLHVWGAGEGAYIELPVFGPSTTRDTVGLIVDTVTDPVSAVLNTKERRMQTSIRVADVVGTRGQLGGTVDSILYDSADSYTQLKQTYLQRRRFELGTDAADTYVDEYSDPYEDPYDF